MNRILLVSLLMLMPASIVWARPALLQGPSVVPSKEYSNDADEDSIGVADAHQVIWWDGAGNAVDVFDYTGAGSYSIDSQVDALANRMDSFFFEAIGDEVMMLASFTGIGEIYYTAPVSTAPQVGIWASAATINAVSLPDDVDALEIWGPIALSSDADRFSLVGDPYIAGIGRVSVWDYDYGAHTATAFITASDIAGAIGRPDLVEAIDLDALMSFDDTILFSLAPIDVFDGGEIWVWTVGDKNATPLVHGGCTWDTAHDVRNHFGVNEENINALEAVPEPATMAMLGLGGLALLLRRRL